MQAIILTKTGDASVLKIKEVEDPKPKTGQILIKNKAIGINFFDICYRKGQYKLPENHNNILGIEGCGIVEAVGPQVIDFKIGDRVAYAAIAGGAYAEKVVINQHHAIIVPQNITDLQAAGSLQKGMMAHTLLLRAYNVRRVKRILVHAAAGGVGQFLCQWARYLGVEVIGTVGIDAKIAFAQANGCHHVINYRNKNFVEEVARITDHNGVGMVLDGVGKDTLTKSLECLWPFGFCASFGEASGNTEALDLNYLVANSIYLARPTLALYKSHRVELALGASEVFYMLEKGVLNPKITPFAFKDVVRTHTLLEGRQSVGSLVLTL